MMKNLQITCSLVVDDSEGRIIEISSTNPIARELLFDLGNQLTLTPEGNRVVTPISREDITDNTILSIRQSKS